MLSKDGTIVAAHRPVGPDRAVPWEPDARWLAAFRTALAEADILSLDVFDTALTRLSDAPVDAFALAEARLVEEIGEDARGFAVARELAELDARALAHSRGHEDITLDEILLALERRLPAAKGRLARFRAAEIAAEQELLVAVPEILDAVRLARETGREVVFVSDMYLSAADIAGFLSAPGYAAPLEVLVSSETRLSKAQGGQWRMLRERFGPAARVLHIGDDAWSDDASPRAAGLATLPITRARSPRRPGGPLAPAVLPFSRAARRAALAGADAAEPAGFMRAFGESWGAIVVGSFLRWLEERAIRLGIERVVFCARDGWLVQRAWEAAGCGARTGIPSSYLHVSRRTLNLADAARPAPDGGLGTAALDTLCASRTPLGTQLDRAGLLGLEELVADVTAEFGSLEAKPEWEELGRLQAILRRHGRAVLRRLQPMREATLAYLAQEGLDGRRHGIVDIGWHGTLQAGLAGLIRDAGHAPALTGLYYGLWPAAQRRRPSPAGWRPPSAATSSPIRHSPACRTRWPCWRTSTWRPPAPRPATAWRAAAGCPCWPRAPSSRCSTPTSSRPSSRGRWTPSRRCSATGAAGRSGSRS
jgi:FMN phosphatase YigB (HAD superfamily)